MLSPFLPENWHLLSGAGARVLCVILSRNLHVGLVSLHVGLVSLIVDEAQTDDITLSLSMKGDKLVSGLTARA